MCIKPSYLRWFYIYKVLRDMEKDAILAANRAGLDINELATEIEIETTYEPCSICKREIMLRQQSVGDHTKSL